MIMPTKYLRTEETIIGVGAILLQHIKQSKNLSELWDEVKKNNTIFTFDRFILGLDFLFILGIIYFKDNEIIRAKL